MRHQIIVATLAIAGMGVGMAQTPPEGAAPAGGPDAVGAQSAPRRSPPEPVDRIDKIADNLYLIPGGGSTSLVWVYSTGVVLVDAKLPGNGAKLMEMIRKVTDKPLTHLVLTHHHRDHTGSAAELPAGVEIVSQENTRTNLINTVEQYRKDETAPGLPTRTFDDHLTLFHGKDTVELYHFGPSHTNGDAIVVFPAAHAVHVGDIMKKKEPPTIDPLQGGSGVKFTTTLKAVREKIKRVDIVIGGHNGSVMTLKDFNRYCVLSELLLAHEKASLRAGKTPEQTLADFKLPAGYEDFTLASTSFGGVSAVRSTLEELRRTRAALQ